jgi:hypothetical protein
MKKNKKQKDIKFLIKKDDGLYGIPSQVVENFTLKDILLLGTLTYIEQKEQLMDDALDSNDSFIEDDKIVDSLEKSLDKLEKLCPNLRNIIKSHVNANIAKC